MTIQSQFSVFLLDFDLLSRCLFLSRCRFINYLLFLSLFARFLDLHFPFHLSSLRVFDFSNFFNLSILWINHFLFLDKVTWFFCEPSHGNSVRTWTDHDSVFEIVLDHAVISQIDKFERCWERNEKRIDSVGQTEIIGNGEFG